MLLLMFCPLLSGSHCNVRIWDSIWKETWNFMFAGNLKSYLKLSGRTRTLRVTWWNSLRMEVSRLNDDNEEEFNICMTSVHLVFDIKLWHISALEPRFVWHQHFYDISALERTTALLLRARRPSVSMTSPRWAEEESKRKITLRL